MPDTGLLPDIYLIYKLQQEVLKFNEIFVSWSSPKLAWWQII